VDSTGSGDGLDGGGALLLEGGRLGAQDQLGGLAGEVGDTRDRGVLVVQLGVVAEDLVGLGGGSQRRSTRRSGLEGSTTDGMSLIREGGLLPS
jgi:hypothetical protein